MPELYAPPKYLDVFLFCIDDSLPKFKPVNWIKRDHLYRLKYISESLNSSEYAVAICDNNNHEINPSEDIKSFRSERFLFFNIILN